MSDLSGPRRWLEAPEDAPQGFQESARAYAELGPSALSRAQSFDALQVRAARVKAAGSYLRLVSWAGVVVLAAGVYAVLQPRAAMPQTRVVPAALVTPLPPTQAEPAAVIAPIPVVTAEPEVLEAKPVVKPRRPRPVAARVEPESPPAPAIDTLQAELQLLMRARRVVRSAPARALALTSEHAAQYPSGAFAEEREVLAIEALRRLGQQREATERAKAFGARFPRSAHRERVEGALAAP
ncbi:MAG TPA: hypothetical protein VJV78_10715 [Polyangiales bacterium]|nr:hypothetical protein [Polyangiales bacterium]